MALKRSLTLLRGRGEPGLTMSLVNTNSLFLFSTAGSGDLLSPRVTRPNEGVVDKIRAAGGRAVRNCGSEPQRLADAAKSEWELNFETVGDPHQEIAEQCKKGLAGIIRQYKNILYHKHR